MRIKKYVFFFIIILTMVIGSLFVFRFFFNNGTTINVYDENRERKLQKVESGDLFEQTFSMEPMVLRGFKIRLLFTEVPLMGDRIILSVFDNKTNELLGARELSTGVLVKDDDLSFRFPNTINYDGRELRLNLQFGEVEFDDGLYIQTVDGNVDAWALAIESDPYFKVIVFIFVLLILMEAAVYYFLFLSKKKLGMEWAYLPAGLAMGIIFSVIIPVMEVPDEPRHLATSYAMSSVILGEDDFAFSGILMREDDANFPYELYKIKRPYMDKVYKNLFSVIENDEMVSTEFLPASNQPYLYIPSIIGLTIGRVLGLNTILTMLLGRIMNVLLFVCVVFFSIRLIPFAKPLLFVYALLPITLQQVASYSRDAVVMTLCVIVISLTLNLAYENSDNKSYKIKLVLLIILAAVLLPAKSFSCFPVSLFPLLLLFPFVKNKYAKLTRNIKRRNLVVIEIIGGIAAVIVGLMLFMKIVNFYIPGSTLSLTVKMFVNTMRFQADNYLFTLLGNYLGWLDIEMPKTFVLPFAIFLLLASIRKSGETAVIETPEKLWMIAVFLAVGIIAMFGMLFLWTPPGYYYIEGVQGRHFLPALILLLMPIYGNKITVDESVQKGVIMATSLWQVVIVIGIMLTQL